jgi:hypothetical protein
MFFKALKKTLEKFTNRLVNGGVNTQKANTSNDVFFIFSFIAEMNSKSTTSLLKCRKFAVILFSFEESPFPRYRFSGSWARHK